MSPDQPARQPAAPYAPTPVLQRRAGGRVLGGVAGGLADHLGVDTTKVRVAFALLAVLGGAGIVAYALLWIFTRAGGDAEATPPAERRRAVGLIALGVAGALASSWLFSGTAASVIVPIVVVGIGAALVWREFDSAGGGDGSGPGDAGQRSALGMPRRPTLLTWARIVAGLSLVVVGLGVVVLAQVDLASLRSSLVAVVVTLIGVGLLTVPIWLRLVRSLNEERAARIRDAEREEIASHLHDSVLQTLALIQKRPEDARQVQRLARSQERDLRRWLFGGGPEGVGGSPGHDGGPVGLAQALREACADVEDRHAVSIDPVLVGDLDEVAAGASATADGVQSALSALVAAAREAMANAAEHAGVRSVDLFAEATEAAEAAGPGGAEGAALVRVYVRDRGVGFDPGAVPADRRGIAGSIRGRMDRFGGQASIRTGGGRGTEVRLTMPFGAAGTVDGRKNADRAAGEDGNNGGDGKDKP